MFATRNYLINLLAQGIGRVLATGSTIVIFILAARHLGIEEFGRYSMLMAFANVFSVLSQFGTNEAMGKAVVSLGSENIERFLGNFFFVRIILGLGAIAIAITAALNFREDLTTPLIICALAIPFVSARFFEPIYQILHRPHYSALASTLYSTLFVSGSVAALYLAARPLQALMIAYAVANIAYFTCSLLLLSRTLKLRLNFDKALTSRIVWLAAPLGPAAFYSILNNRVDIFILSRLTDDFTVGLYSAAYRLVDFLAVAAIILVMPLIPIFSSMASKKKKEIAKPLAKSYEIAAFFTIPFVLVIPTISKPLTILLFGEEYSEAAGLLNILAWVALLVLFSLLSSAANLALGAIKHGYWSGGVAVVTNVLLNFWWIPIYGSNGAACATLASSTVWLLISQYYTQRELGNIFYQSYWLSLLALNGLLWVLLYIWNFADRPALLIFALTGYLLLSYLLKMHPMVTALFFIRQQISKAKATE